MKYLRAVRFLFGTLVIYLVPVLLGWGLGDLPGFFASAPRAGYAGLTVLLGLGVVYHALISSGQIHGGKDEARGQRVARQTVVKMVIILVMYGGLMFLPFVDRRNLAVWSGGEPLRWVGLLGVGLGLGLVLWSGIALGRFYSADVTLQKDHRLITTGLYGVLRHPRYLGVLLTTLGMALLFRSWVGLLALIPVLGIVLFRIRVGVITNDKGHYQVDTAFLGTADIPTAEVPGGCFRCNYGDFLERIAQLQQQARPEVLFAESVGSCVDLVGPVLLPLAALSKNGARVTYSVFVDIRLLRRHLAGLPLPFSDNITYIFGNCSAKVGRT